MARFTPSAAARRFLRAAVIGGIVAGVVSTLVQVILWLLFTDAFPAILWRDAGLTAAILFGPRAAERGAGESWPLVAAATLIHFGLSVIYGAVFCAAARDRSRPGVVATGLLLGAALYFVNLHGFTLIFPWMAAARGGITLAAHLAFGVSATLVGRWLLDRGNG